MRNVLIMMALAVSACTSTAQTQFTKGSSVNGWRGAQNNGFYSDKGLLNQWPAEGPQKIFEVEDAGKGYSSAQVVGDRIYLTGLNDQEDAFSAFFFLCGCNGFRERSFHCRRQFP